MEGTSTFGLVTNIKQITDAPSHLSNYISSDFGSTEGIPQTPRQGANVAEVNVLANFDPTILVEKFGNSGTQLFLSAKGIDSSEVQEHWERKSISREITFEEDTSDYATIVETINAICEDLSQELVASEFTFKTITVKVRYQNFETHTHGETLSFYTDRTKDIQKSAGTLVQIGES